jgi:hypothetical protein
MSDDNLDLLNENLICDYCGRAFKTPSNSTLKGLGGAVIATDKKGIIKIMNPCGRH